MTRASIHVNHISRVEGHGNVHVVIDNDAVKTIEVNVVEPARLFESMVVGRPYYDAPYISSRICGICSASHVVTDLRAIEQALEIQVTERVSILRKLLVYGSYLQNHATHLFVFSAPDFVRRSSVFELADSSKDLLDKALGLKALGNKLCTLIGGRCVHPITAVVGGFTGEISSREYLELADELEAAIPFACEAVDYFHSFPVPSIATKGELLGMTGEGCYPIIESNEALFARSNQVFTCDDVLNVIEEYQVDHSAALFARKKDDASTYMVSALARINLSWDGLSYTAKKAAAKVGLRPPELNPYLNNLAQAIEIVDALVRCADLCRQLADLSYGGSSLPQEFKVRAGKGVGFTEAPRGSLFHLLELDDEGFIQHASILTPTAQNIANLESDLRSLAEELISEGAGEEDVRIDVEKLVRAYDLCLSCSVH